MVIIFFQRPALTEFVIKTSGVDERFVFKKTCLSCFKEKINGKITIFEPLIDIFYSDDESGSSNKLSVGVAHTKDENKDSYFCNYFGIPMDNQEDYGRYTFDTKYDFCDISYGHIYLIVQKFLYDRPTMFTEVSHREVEMGVKIKKTKKQTVRKRIVKTVKNFCLNPIEYNNYVGKHKVITCPSWGVIGHTRTLKSGKQIWIKPYRKGKERNNPDAYSPKQYDLVTAI